LANWIAFKTFPLPPFKGELGEGIVLEGVREYPFRKDLPGLAGALLVLYEFYGLTPGETGGFSYFHEMTASRAVGGGTANKVVPPSKNSGNS